MTSSQSSTFDAHTHPTRPASVWLRLGHARDWHAPEICAFVITLIVMFLYGKLTQPEGGDSAIWDYVAQCILRGQIPYRDVVEIKSPLSAYLSAAVMYAGKSLGIRDVIAVRLLNVLMAGVLSTVTYLVGATCFRSRIAAAIAFVIPLIPPHFTEWVLGGTEPKLPMILFGMLSVLSTLRRRPFWAGFFSMLACLSWQPGLMFTGVAFLFFSRYLTRWRDGAAAKLLAGAAVPLIVAVSYFYWVGALADFWSWTVSFDLNVYAPGTAKSLGGTLAVMWKVLLRVFRFDLLFVGLAVGGFVMCSLDRFKQRQTSEPNSSGEVLLMLPLVYMGFCLINFQSGPDLIPLFPFIGLFAGYLIVSLSRRADGRLAQLIPLLALVAVLALTLVRSFTHRGSADATLYTQDRQLAEVSKLLAPQDRIYVHGALEILVLLNRANMNPYIFLDRGKDNWIAKRKGIEFGEIIDGMESQAPKIVAATRLAKVGHRREIENWIASHYERLDVPDYGDIYVRKPR